MLHGRQRGARAASSAPEGAAKPGARAVAAVLWSAAPAAAPEPTAVAGRLAGRAAATAGVAPDGLPGWARQQRTKPSGSTGGAGSRPAGRCFGCLGAAWPPAGEGPEARVKTGGEAAGASAGAGGHARAEHVGTHVYLRARLGGRVEWGGRGARGGHACPWPQHRRSPHQRPGDRARTAQFPCWHCLPAGAGKGAEGCPRGRDRLRPTAE